MYFLVTLAILTFLHTIVDSERHDNLKERVAMLEKKNEMIESNLEIMNYALEKQGLYIYKTKD